MGAESESQESFGYSLNCSNGVSDCQPEASHHGPRGREYSFSLKEKYARGALSIIVKFDGVPPWEFSDNSPFISPASDHITLHHSVQTPIGVENLEGWMAGNSQYRHNDCVFIRIIEFMEIVEFITTTTAEGFEAPEQVFHPLMGCHYSIATSFEIDPVIACREGSVVILNAVTQPREFPSSMVKGAPQIVDSVCYYKGENCRRFFEKTHLDGQTPSGGVALDTKTVWFFSDKSRRLPFKVSNVIIGPLDFLFRAVEQCPNS